MLDAHTFYFKMTMKHNVEWPLEKHVCENPFSSMWRKLNGNFVIFSCISKFVKLAEIALCRCLAMLRMNRHSPP